MILPILQTLRSDSDDNISDLVGTWLSQPGNLTACVGENVTFAWQYNASTLDPVGGVHVRKYDPVTTYIAWFNNTIMKNQTLPTVIPYRNAGMILLNVQLSDAGMYKSGVYFISGTGMESTTYLTVLNGNYLSVPLFLQNYGDLIKLHIRLIICFKITYNSVWYF